MALEERKSDHAKGFRMSLTVIQAKGYIIFTTILVLVIYKHESMNAYCQN
jgi:hypothetical protein